MGIVIRVNGSGAGNGFLIAPDNGCIFSVAVIPINATPVSNAQGDTIINVHVDGSTTSFSLTAISNPEIWFKGRFEARFASRRDLWQS